MENQLDQAAQEGDIAALYAAIRNDPFVLDKIESIPFTDTPMHIAASAGQTHFALEIMLLKPSLSRKLNQDGSSPMHLGIINGQDQVVRGLLSKDKDLARVVGKEGYTPLHCLALTTANPSLLSEMLSVCPESLMDFTVKGETVFHLAVKNNQLQVFQALVEILKIPMKEILRRQDEDGHPFFHHAIKQSRLDVMELVFKKYGSNVNCLGLHLRDNNGKDARRLAQELPETHEYKDSMIDILHLDSSSITGKYTRSINYGLSMIVEKLPDDSQDALLVVLALVNATSFQVGVNPPGGFWQDDGVTSSGRRYVAGTPILATTSPGLYFVTSFFTMAGFMTSFFLMYLLTIKMPMNKLLMVTLSLLSYSYFFAFIAITRRLVWIILGAYGSISLLVGLCYVVFFIRWEKRQEFEAQQENNRWRLAHPDLDRMYNTPEESVL
ncbi:hypothetical protein ACHQM5_011179 [Ranunculus cassubicifolius]